MKVKEEAIKSGIRLTVTLPRVVAKNGRVAHVIVDDETILEGSGDDDVAPYIYGTACHGGQGYLYTFQDKDSDNWDTRFAREDEATCTKCMKLLRKLVQAEFA